MNDRIVIFTDNLAQGGAQRIALSVASYLHARGQLARFVSLYSAGRAVDTTQLRFPVSFLFGDNWRKSDYVRCFPKAYNVLRELRPTVVIATLIPSNLLAIVVGRMMGRSRPMIVVREANTLYRRARALGGRAMLLYWAARLFYPRADAVIAPSAGVARDLVDHVGVPEAKVHVLYSPTVTKGLAAEAAAPLAHAYLGGEGRKLFVAAGRLSQAKGFDVLLDAFAIVAAAQPEARLIILGEGDRRTTLESQRRALDLEASVDLPGFVANPFPYMKAADAFVLSSRFEGLPNVLIQAMACGTTPVSTTCPSGPDEILESGRHGYLVPVDDSVALAAAMQQALAAPIAREQLLARARDFDEDLCLDRYARLIADIKRS